MNSSVTINDRGSLLVSGVKSVESVTDSKIAVFTEQGDLVIKGSGLVSEEFDPGSGIFRANGRIDAVSYRTGKRHLPDNVISRLFR